MKKIKNRIEKTAGQQGVSTPGKFATIISTHGINNTIYLNIFSQKQKTRKF